LKNHQAYTCADIGRVWFLSNLISLSKGPETGHFVAFFNNFQYFRMHCLMRDISEKWSRKPNYHMVSWVSMQPDASHVDMFSGWTLSTKEEKWLINTLHSNIIFSIQKW
jgi:hypothetical protein